ncbi:hypothetical protein B0H11DRAFT_1710127 [Mycena galericulata]|nr:hypothetical protein B0H11DRAFT_1710127 [Mycena galericulata]
MRDLWATHAIETGSLTAVLPVTLLSLPVLQTTLSPFFDSLSCVSKVVVVCPEPLLAQSRAAIRELVRSAPENINHPDVSLHSWPGGSDPTAVVLQAAARASTKWVMLLDDAGFSGLSERTRGMLLCPVAADLPIGPRGVLGTQSCAPPSPQTRPVSYLLPPFTLPSTLVQGSHADWSDLGNTISKSRQDQLGGVLRGYGDPDVNWCNGVCNHDISPLVKETSTSSFPYNGPSRSSSLPGRFVFLLPNIEDLLLVQQLLCTLQNAGHSLKILLYSDFRPAPGIREPQLRCRLPYDAPSATRHIFSTIHDWMERTEPEADIVFTVDDAATRPVTSERGTVIRIPREDLMHVDWMGSLALAEWTNWNVPRIDVSIITQDRPRSLARLMSSLTQARFFGDSVSLRLNIEQSSDLETISMVGAFNWRHGSVFTHRRVIHGGLLPAVVESWYPNSNDSYGLLLEDDVELSPLFYAWIKMGILRYRYGEARNQTAQLFGISLYQQNNIELHPEGRKLFDPRRLFLKNGVVDPSTPYLSQIPCSWGAVYFPEHWREFHDYLAERLSESTMEIERIVVPEVRSNNWVKSWKKYFIEMVYLRGYVMLYPNYADFVSLSTNHLEVGSHVKERPKEKQEVFRLPLMRLSESGKLLDLPGGTLPRWEELPVLNLTGFISSLSGIVPVS